MVTATSEVSTTDTTTQVTHFEHLAISLQLNYVGGRLEDAVVNDERDLISRDFEPEDWADVLHGELSPAELSRRRHTICNRLHVANLAAELLTRQSELGDASQATQFVRMILESLTELNELAACQADKS
jgi:hypothetical protein